MTVVGKTIELPHIASPSKEQVDQHHGTPPSSRYYNL
jgi:hypothetical protein